jgi:hypothetical protein
LHFDPTSPSDVPRFAIAGHDSGGLARNIQIDRRDDRTLPAIDRMPLG